MPFPDFHAGRPWPQTVMTQVHDFEHGPFQVVCIATPNGTRWSSAAMLMRLDSRGFDDRPRWFAHDLPTPGAALAYAERRARAMIDADEVDPGMMLAPALAAGLHGRATAIPR